MTNENEDKKSAIDSLSEKFATFSYIEGVKCRIEELEEFANFVGVGSQTAYENKANLNQDQVAAVSNVLKLIHDHTMAKIQFWRNELSEIELKGL